MNSSFHYSRPSHQPVTGLVAMVIAFLVTATLSISPALAGDSLLPSYPQGKGEQCVEDTGVMRRRHFEFILHQRDDTMHKGIRTKQHSLKNCISCHASKNDAGEYLPINAPGQFCESCHSYAAVTIDCFECHRTTPGDAAAAKGPNPHAE